jgi:hypothetical protein
MISRHYECALGFSPHGKNIETECISEQNDGKIIWTSDKESNIRMDKVKQLGAEELHSSSNITSMT